MTAEEIYTVVLKEYGEMPDLAGFDLHIEPGDLEGASHRGLDFPSLDERRHLRSVILREMMRELATRQHGRLPAELQREVELSTRTEVSWQQLLARFMNGLRRTDYRLFPFNKKHLWRGIYLPSLGVPGPDHLVLAVDTSGSVSPAMLGQFMAELDRLRSMTECRMTLLHCDAAVQKVDEIGAGETSILPGQRTRLAGGGGTDFQPVFNWIAKKGRDGGRPDALIYCTDGYGTFPTKAPPYPVVWVVTASGTQQFPFGLVIRLKEV
jgi:predicted metal-dependent peptidase